MISRELLLISALWLHVWRGTALGAGGRHAAATGGKWTRRTLHGRLTSNGGVMLLAMAERRLGLADNLARVFPDRRDEKQAPKWWGVP
jgi:hypothetical protein